MKNILFVFLVAWTTSGLAQTTTNPIDQLIQVTKNGLQQPKEVSFDNQIYCLKVGEWIIPVSKNTLTKIEVEKDQYEVEFSLQKGTEVTSSADLNWKRASFALPFKSKQAAKNFIAHFKELTEKENTN